MSEPEVLRGDSTPIHQPNILDDARLLIAGELDAIDSEVAIRVGEYVLETHQVLNEKDEVINRLLKEVCTDELTQCANRKALPDLFAKHGLEALEQGRAFVLLFADVDKLKLVNDTYDHETGDRYLRSVAALLKSWAPDNGHSVVRWGGDEFSIIGTLPLTNDVKVTAQREEKSLQTHVNRGLQNGFGKTVTPGVAATIGVTPGVKIFMPEEVQEIVDHLAQAATPAEAAHMLGNVIKDIHHMADKRMYLNKSSAEEV
jgi:diguanylate cyclase (GGDEF)-like protein